MDVVVFSLRSRPGVVGPEICIEVNGRELAQVVGAIERTAIERSGDSPAIAGSYTGYSPVQLTRSVSVHFLGSEESHLDCGPVDKTALLDCECGCPGCWTLMARVVTTPETVTWTDFEQVHRDLEYDGLSLMFDRGQYESALASIVAVQ